MNDSEDAFIYALTSHMLSAIEEPGVATASTEFTIHNSWDSEWEADWPMTIAQLATATPWIYPLVGPVSIVPGMCDVSAY